VLRGDGKANETQDTSRPDEPSPCPTPTSQRRPQEEAKKSTAPVFPADDRVDILPPERDFKLAEEAQIPLVIHAKGLVSVKSIQGQYRGGNSLRPSTIIGSQKTLSVLYRGDGSAYVQVTPMGLGKVRLYLSGKFPDGGSFMKSTDLEVDVPNRKPVKLVVGHGGMPNSPSPVIFLQMTGQHRNSVNVNALYENVKELIEIPPSFVKFQVRTHGNSPAIHLDEATGIITPIHVGQELVVTRFGGLKNLTCVVVTQNSFDGYDHSVCKDLLLPGEALDLPSLLRK
jgi:hypothetical protein